MSVMCARCESFTCRTGSRSAAPSTCPMHESFPSFEALYATAERQRMAYESAIVEVTGYGRWTRIEEIVQLADRMGYARLGIGHCPPTEAEAKRVAHLLERRGLEPILPEAVVQCDPAGQATLFAERRSQFNVVAGMCVGHDAIFIRHSTVPVTSLIVSDRRFRDNPAAALYTSRSYTRDALYQKQRRAGPQPFAGWDTVTLARVAAEVGVAAGEDWCRLEEIMEFANRLGARHLGIVFCVGFRNEASLLTDVLEANRCQVSSACCKTGSVPKEALGIEESQKLHPHRPEMMCNSLAQAELLNRENVQLVLLLGQCVGHDSATLSLLRAPAVCVVAKDRVLGHNTVAALGCGPTSQ